MLMIKWKSGLSNGYADLFPSRWFEQDGEWSQREHDVKTPRGGFLPARCAVHVNANVASMDYRGYPSFNEPSHHIGILQIVFTDAQRSKVEKVLWQVDGTDEIIKEDVDVLGVELPLEGLETFDPTNIEDGRDRIKRMVVLRQGQAIFRQKLMVAYENRCAITGCEIPQVLEAAHIMPYLGEHTNHVTNGLLLRADIHTMFDLGLFKIDRDYRITAEQHIKDAYDLPPEIKYLPADNKLWPSPDAFAEKKAGPVIALAD
jgi:hypothetical protein